MTHHPFFVLHGRVLKKVDPLRVTWLLAERNYTRIYLNNNTFYHVRSSLSSVVEKLPPDLFIRVHRSLIVSILFLDDVEKDHLHVCGKPFPIGKRYYHSVMERLNIIE